MIIERDVTDLGVAPVDERSHEEREADARRLRMLRHRDPGPTGPEATEEQRRRAIEEAIAACRWSKPSRSRRLLTHCPRCSASTGEWCRVAGHSRLGRLCEDRKEG